MGVMGAFIFAAQMINFTIPITGSSGHIGGGILLAAMIGGFPALLSISAVLIIQCLFFADGGLLALGCNIFNMGVVPCLLIYPLIFRPIAGKGMASAHRGLTDTNKRPANVNRGPTAGSITLASMAAVVIGLQLGAFGVVLQTQLSGIAELPFTTFLFFMQPIHLAIGIVEGIITAAILCFVYKMRPEIMEGVSGRAPTQNGVPVGDVLIALAVATVLVGGALSLFASSYPDGLEWAIEKAAGTEEPKTDGASLQGAVRFQEATSFMPDYDFKDAEGSGIGTTVAGMVGGGMTFMLAGATAFAISTVKKRKKRAA
jgi:cobalt/nickel transport system permease protein